jgi:DNA polymerase (family 10)
MGAKSEKNILKGLQILEEASGRFLYKAAADHAATLGRYLDGLDGVRRWEVAGSLRRRKATIGDLDILVEARHRKKATKEILVYEAIDEVISRGAERVSVRLRGGLQVDFRFFDAANFGSALVYFTGSKAHNIALRKRAQSRGWKLNEYGVMKNGRRLAGKDEKSVYHRLNLPWIEPELREDRGEIRAAEEDKLPDLIQAGDLRGDLQSHTNVTDGSASIEEMAEAAHERGYEYLAITDHSKRVTMAKGLDEDGLRRHAENVREIARKYKDMWLMAGIEVDVLKSGRLDLDEDVLAEMDWVLAAIHYDMDLDEGKMTDRLVSAIGSGVVHAIAHPLNRLIGQREGIRLDLDRVLEACNEHDVRLEINAQPDRLDLPDTYCKRALEAGVGFTIGSDAHKPSDLDFLPLAVHVARRGWLGPGHVLNTVTRKQLEKRIRRS